MQVLQCCCPPLCLLLLSAYSGKGVKGDGRGGEASSPDTLVKTDMGRVLEIHVAETREYLRELMIKLYKRDPRELKKSPYKTIDENLVRLFDTKHDWDFPGLDGKEGIDAARLIFADDYQGDRVFSFVAGLTSMVMNAYNNKTEFYLLQSVNPQNLYNSTRNMEIAVEAEA